jgi:hypothetical protein
LGRWCRRDAPWRSGFGGGKSGCHVSLVGRRLYLRVSELRRRLGRRLPVIDNNECETGHAGLTVKHECRLETDCSPSLHQLTYHAVKGEVFPSRLPRQRREVQGEYDAAASEPRAESHPRRATMESRARVDREVRMSRIDSPPRINDDRDLLAASRRCSVRRKRDGTT